MAVAGLLYLNKVVVVAIPISIVGLQEISQEILCMEGREVGMTGKEVEDMDLPLLVVMHFHHPDLGVVTDLVADPLLPIVTGMLQMMIIISCVVLLFIC